jgi:hypothetical protein
MSTSILIYGESGTGKSTSIHNLSANETFIIAATNKPLPFRGWRTKYHPFDGNLGNYIVEDDCNRIIDTMKFISEKRMDIKTIIIDDFQYIMSNQFMRRAKEKGYEKFTDIGESTWRVIEKSAKLRNDIKVIFLAHSDTQDGKTKLKTIGKMLDDKVCLEGLFTIVLNSTISDGQFLFITQNTGYSISKSPMGMFKDAAIKNDLSIVIKAIDDYDNSDEAEELLLYIQQLSKCCNVDSLKEKLIELRKTCKTQGFSDKFINDLIQEATKLSKNFNQSNQLTKKEESINEQL